MRIARFFRWFVLGTSCFLAGVGTAEVTDVIIRRNDRTTENIVVSADEFTEVKYSLPGAAAAGSFPADDVIAVVYGDEPAAFNNARALFEEKKYDKALAKYTEAGGAKIPRPWPNVYVPFGRGECKRLLAKFQEAVPDYQEVLGKDPKSRLVPPALSGMAECYLKLGGENFAKAWETYEKLGNGGYGARWKFEADFGKGLVRETEALAVCSADAQKGAALLQEALQLYEALITELSKEENRADERKLALLFRAKSHKGMVISAQGKTDDAVSWFTQLIQESREAKLTPVEAFIGRGDTFYQSKQFRRALWDYMRVAAVYFYEPPQHRHAVAQCMECFRSIGDTNRANEYAAVLKQFYQEVAPEPVLVAKPEVQPIQRQQPQPPTPAQADIVVIKAETKAYVNQKEVGTLKPGEEYALVSTQGEWVGIQLKDGTKPWIAKKDCEIRKPAPLAPQPPQAKTLTVKNDGAIVYDQGVEVAKVKKDEKYPIVEYDKETGYYGIQLKVNGKDMTGWISADDVQVEGGPK